MKKASLIFHFKKIILTVAAVSISGVLSAAVGIGGDTVAPAKAEKNVPSQDRQTRALEFYIASLMEKNPAKRAELLLESVKLNPLSRLPLLLLIKTLDDAPAGILVVKKELDKIKKEYPRSIFLALQSALIDCKAGGSPAETVKHLVPIMRLVPSKRDLKDFHALSLLYIELLLNSCTKTEDLPFQPTDIPLKESALLYYAVAAQRDRLSGVNSIASAQVEKLLNEMADAEFKKLPDFRRHLSILSTLQKYNAAAKAAEKMVKKHATPETIRYYLEMLSHCKDDKLLIRELKKYPALPVEFCTQMRFQCYIDLGDFKRAKAELANFRHPQKHIEKSLFLAQLMRDAQRVEELIKSQSSSSKDNASLALKYLALAEMNKDMAALKKAKELLNTSYMQNPVFANAVGYVSLVLDHDISHAETLIEFALTRDPFNAAYLDSLAWAKFKKKEYDQALKYIQQAFRCVTSQVGGAAMAEHAGDIYQALGKHRNAQKYYKLALELYEENKTNNSDIDPETVRKKINTK